jgi:NHL repeat
MGHRACRPRQEGRSLDYALFIRRRRPGHPGVLERSDGVAINPRGDLYIADAGNNWIQEVDRREERHQADADPESGPGDLACRRVKQVGQY